MLISLVLGGFVGAVLGLTGAGGGILAVPALVVGMSWPMQQATPVALIAVAVGETEVRPQRANPEVLKHHWWKFCALKRVWQLNQELLQERSALLPLSPPRV